MLERIKSFILHSLAAKFALVAALIALLGGARAYEELQMAYFPKTYEITGIASSVVPVRGMIVTTGAFRQEAAALASGKLSIPLMANHSNNIQDIVGKITALDLRFGKTLFKAEIIANKANRAVISQLLDGTLTDVSIGFIPTEYEQAGNVVLIREIDLFEISLVFAGADPTARILTVKEKE